MKFEDRNTPNFWTYVHPMKNKDYLRHFTEFFYKFLFSRIKFLLHKIQNWNFTFFPRWARYSLAFLHNFCNGFGDTLHPFFNYYIFLLGRCRRNFQKLKRKGILSKMFWGTIKIYTIISQNIFRSLKRNNFKIQNITTLFHG